MLRHVFEWCQPLWPLTNETLKASTYHGTSLHLNYPNIRLYDARHPPFHGFPTPEDYGSPADNNGAPARAIAHTGGSLNDDSSEGRRMGRASTLSGVEGAVVEIGIVGGGSVYLRIIVGIPLRS